MKQETKDLAELVFGKMTGVNHTYRFSGIIKSKEQSVAEHSYWTALIAGSLANYENEMRRRNGKFLAKIDIGLLYQQALFHDIEEVITGDINHLFKHRKEGQDFRKLLHDLTVASVKEELFDKILNGQNYFEDWQSSHLDNENNFLIKMGDWLQLLQYTNEEYNRGNIYFTSTIKRVLKLIEDKNNAESLKDRFLYVPDLIKELMTNYLETQNFNKK